MKRPLPPRRGSPPGRRAAWLLLSVPLALAGFGCRSGSSGSTKPAPCTGLDPEECLLPWPSSAYLVPDSSTRTGWRVQIPSAAMPQDRHGKSVDPTPWNRWDGFEAMTTLVAEFASVVDPTPLPTRHDPGASLGATSPTVLIDVDTGARVPHFAEVETASDVAPGHTTLYLRPAARLTEGHHYAVAVRALVDKDGSAPAVSEGFAALRDRSPSAPAARQASFERDVFGPLEKAGVARSSLQLAWDFRTGSGNVAWGDLLAMRDAAIAAAGPGGIGCTVSSVIQLAADPEIDRQIEGTVTVPSFLETGPDGRARIARDAGGNPEIRGTLEAPFTALIPRSAVTRLAQGNGPAPVWVYGHGLFSSREELTLDFGRDTASQAGAIAVATDFTGLTQGDQADVLEAFEDLSRFPEILERLRQGLIDTLLLPRTVAGACSLLAAFQSNGAPLADPADLDYFGNSLGGTLGSTLAALSPDMDRFALGVGALDLPVMMPRAYGWFQIEFFFKSAFPRRIDRDLLVVMSGHEWDLVEGSYAPHVLSDPLPGSKARRVLFQIGLNDTSSANVASEIAGRTLGLPELTPTAHAVWGLAPTAPPVESAFVVYDLGAAPLPEGTTASPTANLVHEGVRRDPRAQAQIASFLHSGGRVVDTCGGPCVPPAP